MSHYPQFLPATNDDSPIDAISTADSQKFYPIQTGHDLTIAKQHLDQGLNLNRTLHGTLVRTMHHASNAADLSFLASLIDCLNRQEQMLLVAQKETSLFVPQSQPAWGNSNLFPAHQ